MIDSSTFGIISVSQKRINSFLSKFGSDLQISVSTSLNSVVEKRLLNRPLNLSVTALETLTKLLSLSSYLYLSSEIFLK